LRFCLCEYGGGGKANSSVSVATAKDAGLCLLLRPEVDRKKKTERINLYLSILAMDQSFLMFKVFGCKLHILVTTVRRPQSGAYFNLLFWVFLKLPFYCHFHHMARAERLVSNAFQRHVYFMFRTEV